jgi:uncharacterized protein HemX
MIFLQATTDTELGKDLSNETISQLKHFIDMASQTSPDSGNGYGLALVALILVAIAAAGLFIWRTKVQDRKDKAAQDDIAAQILRLGTEYRSEIRESETRITERLDKLEGRVSDNGNMLISHGNRLTAIEAKE